MDDRATTDAGTGAAPPSRGRGRAGAASAGPADGVPDASAEDELLRLALDHTPSAAAYHDCEQRFLHVNAEWERFHGIPRERVIGLTIAEVLGPRVHARVRPHVERALAGERVRFEDREPGKFGPGRDGWTEETYVPHRDASGRVLGVFAYAPDITARKVAKAALDESEGRLRTLIDGMPQLVWRSCDLGLWTWSSPQWRAYTGQTMEGSLDRGWLEAVHPDDHPPAMTAWEAARRTGRVDVEYRVRRASDGAYLWHHTRSLPVRDANGRIVEWLGTTTDIQKLKELQARQSVLVAELQHRTRNLIAVVRSIADQTMKRTGPSPMFIERFGDRMAALGRVQGLLSRADDEPITVDALIRSELDALGAGSRARLDGPPVRLRAAIVQTLALALHELATNARKHGALSGSDGRLDVTWTVRDGDGRRRLRLDWAEEAGRPIEVADAARDGYGRELIERALPYSLGALTEYTLTESGVRCSIDLPLERSSRKERS